MQAHSQAAKQIVHTNQREFLMNDSESMQDKVNEAVHEVTREKRTYYFVATDIKKFENKKEVEDYLTSEKPENVRIVRGQEVVAEAKQVFVLV